MKIKEEKPRYLECVLTDEEIQDLGKEISNIVSEKTTLEAEKKAASSSYTRDIKQKDRQINQKANLINEGIEMRDIFCSVVFNNPVPGQKIVTREDTGEEWQEAMTESEFNLFNQPGKSEEE